MASYGHCEVLGEILGLSHRNHVFSSGRIGGPARAGQQPHTGPAQREGKPAGVCRKISNLWKSCQALPGLTKVTAVDTQ